MHTESNPRQPAIAATSAESHEATMIDREAASQATSAKPKPAAAKKPTTKQSARQRAGTRPTAAKKPDATPGKTAKPAAKAPSARPAPTTPSKAPREGSTMWAVLQVLSGTTEPLSAKEIYAQIAERKLASGLKGKTPDQTIAAKLAVAAKKGEYVQRAAPGKFQLLKERS